MSQQTYQTPDLSVAAFLLCQPVKFKGMKKIGDMKWCFQFSPVKKAEALVNNYVAGKAMVSARTYASAMKSARDLLFYEERSERQARVERIRAMQQQKMVQGGAAIEATKGA